MALINCNTTKQQNSKALNSFPSKTLQNLKCNLSHLTILDRESKSSVCKTDHTHIIKYDSPKTKSSLSVSFLKFGNTKYTLHNYNTRKPRKDPHNHIVQTSLNHKATFNSRTAMLSTYRIGCSKETFKRRETVNECVKVYVTKLQANTNTHNTHTKIKNTCTQQTYSISRIWATVHDRRHHQAQLIRNTPKHHQTRFLLTQKNDSTHTHTHTVIEFQWTLCATHICERALNVMCVTPKRTEWTTIPNTTLFQKKQQNDDDDNDLWWWCILINFNQVPVNTHTHTHNTHTHWLIRNKLSSEAHRNVSAASNNSSNNLGKNRKTTIH